MQQNSPPPIHPGAYVKEHVFTEGIKVTKAAELMRIGRPALSNFLNGKASLSQAMATRLEKTFGADKASLLAMQQKYDAFLNSEQERCIAVKSYTPDFLTIKANDIENWAKNIEARALLPAFLRRLANSTGSKIMHIDFPAYDNSQRHGWDGYVEAQNATPWVPEGFSGWEFGCDKKTLTKANYDYTNRTKNCEKKERDKTVFIFVTPCNWLGKDKWANEKCSEKKWKDVRAYDASDLEQWLEQSIPGQVWMANQLGIPREECKTLTEYWDEWSGVSTPSISPKIFNSSIAAHREKLLKWHQSLPARPLLVTADSKEEALAFIASAALNAEGLEQFVEHAVIVSSADAAKKLAAMSADFIPIVHTSDAETELAHSTHNRRAIVIVEKSTIGNDPDNISVELPSYECFREALTDMGFNDSDIGHHSSQSGKSPTILRRHLATLPALKTPPWASDSTRIKTMVPLVLAGVWKSSQNGDQEILSYLAGKDYADIERNVAELASLDGSPIWSESQYRGVVSKLDCFNAVSNQITAEDLDSFFFIAEVVLSEDDPSLDLEKDERWAANLHNKVRDHSDAIRKSICETLIILAVYGNGLFGRRLGYDAEGWVSALIRKLLENKGSRVWQSQQGELPMYAEAAPDTFLDIIDQELSKKESAFAPLFEPAETGPFSRCERTGMLWALELLAWHPSRLARVVLIIARLCRFELEDNWANKPINSLNDILLSWRPHTAATLQERCDVLTLLCKEHPDVGWDICMQHLKPGSSVTSDTYRPRWRGDASGVLQNVRDKGCYDFLKKCRELVFTRLSHTRNTLEDLIDCLSSMDEKGKETVASRINDWLSSSPPKGEIVKLREHVRTRALTYRARLHQKNKLSDYADGKKIYDLLEPKDVVLKHQWLFAKNWVEYSPDELEDEALDHGERERKLNEQKVAALNEIIATAGDEGLVRLCRGVEAGYNIGWHLGHNVMDADQLLAFAGKCLLTETCRDIRQIDSCLSGILHQFEDADNGKAFILRLLDTLAQRGSNINYQIRIFINAPFSRGTWELVEPVGEIIAKKYWEDVVPCWRDHSPEDLNYLVEKLMEAGRPRAAFYVAHLEPDSIDSKRLIKLLNEIGTSTSEPEGHYQSAVYEIEDALESLDQRDDVDRKELVRLEYLYIDLLTSSSKYSFPNLSRELAQSPLLFMQMIAMYFRRDDDGKDPDEWRLPKDPEQARNAAEKAYTALEYTHWIPGTQKDGTIDIDQLRDWIAEVRKLAKKNSRAKIADQKIGLVLSRSGAGADGIWPQEEVRQVFEDVASPEISIGMELGVYNSRGVHSVAADGAPELELARKYYDFADAIMNETPFVGRMLQNIAKRYERDAEHHVSDDRVQRRLRG